MMDLGASNVLSEGEEEESTAVQETKQSPGCLTITVPCDRIDKERSELTSNSSKPANEQDEPDTFELAYGDNTPTSKRKWTSDVWNSVKRIKSKDELLPKEFKGMTHICILCSKGLRMTKDKAKKNLWLTTRALQHLNLECPKKHESKSNAATKSNATATLKKLKVQRSLYDAGKGFFRV